jgi:hypothetical protein
MVMENTSCNSAICSEMYLNTAPSQPPKAAVAKCRGIATLMPNRFRRADNALNLRLCHANRNTAQSVGRNRIGKDEETQEAKHHQSETTNQDFASMFHGNVKTPNDQELSHRRTESEVNQ